MDFFTGMFYLTIAIIFGIIGLGLGAVGTLLSVKLFNKISKKYEIELY